jgi:hypothetical protein
MREHRLAERAHAEHADAALACRPHFEGLPLPTLLGTAVGRHVAMEIEHGVCDVLDHALHDSGLDHAHDGHTRWQRSEVELVDAGSCRVDELQVRKARGQVARRLPDGKVSHCVCVADVWPKAELDLRRFATEDLGPLLAALTVGLVDQDRPHRQPSACVTIA